MSGSGQPVPVTVPVVRRGDHPLEEPCLAITAASMPSSGWRALLDGARSLTPVLSALALLLGVLAPILAALPAQAGPAAQTQITEATPAPGAVQAQGLAQVGALVVAGQPISAVRGTLDGDPISLALDGPGDRRTARADVDLRAGSRVLSLTATTADGQDVTRTWRFTVADMTTTRLGGTTRTDTARLVAAATVDRPAAEAVLTRSDGFADALAGVGLAHAMGGPLLLSAPSGLDDATRRALDDSVEPGGRIHLLGGTDALSVTVEQQLRDLGFTTTRLAGADRFATAVAIADALAEDTDRGEAAPVTAVIASGESFPDALAIAPPAATRGWPLLLTGRDRLPDATRAFLTDHGVTHLEIVGGEAAVSAAVATELALAATVRRTSGPSRADTAAAIAARFAAPADRAVLVSGHTFADALTGGVAAARWDAPLLLAGAALPDVTAEIIAFRRTDDLVVVGGTAAVSHAAVRAALRARADGGVVEVEGPRPGRVFTQSEDPGQGLTPLRLRLPGTALDDRSQVAVHVDGREAPTRVRQEADVLDVTVLDLPASLPAHGEVPVRITASLVGAQRAGHAEFDVVLRLAPATVTTVEGHVAVAGAGPVVGTGGPLRTYSLEVEAATGVDVRAFAAEAEAILSDARSWTGRGGLRFQRVEPSQAQFRVLLARPATVDALCRQAGLDTAGRFSCWNGRFAALNLGNWTNGVAAFDGPLATYRGYQVNHEVGHALGHGHSGCPRAGALAPVMMQQSKGTGSCVPNAWPYP